MLSVVVSTRDKWPWLRTTLPVLLREAARVAEVAEVVVVDDGSCDGTPKFLESLVAVGVGPPRLVAVRRERHGLAASRNAGAAVAAGTHLLFLDDDILVTAGALPAFVGGIAHDPGAVHVGWLRNVALAHVPAVLEAAGKIPAAQLEEWCSPVPMYAAMGTLCAHADGARPAVWWAVVTGGNLCVPARALREVGGFDEEFTGWGPEDADLCYRLFLRGTTATHHAAARLFHLDHPRAPGQVTASLMRNATRFFRKHGKPADLLDYLCFFNGELTLDAFNARVAARHGLAVNAGHAASAADDFRLDMAYVTQRGQLVARGRR